MRPIALPSTSISARISVVGSSLEGFAPFISKMYGKLAGHCISARCTGRLAVRAARLMGNLAVEVRRCASFVLVVAAAKSSPVAFYAATFLRLAIDRL